MRVSHAAHLLFASIFSLVCLPARSGEDPPGELPHPLCRAHARVPLAQSRGEIIDESGALGAAVRGRSILVSCEAAEDAGSMDAAAAAAAARGGQGRRRHGEGEGEGEHGRVERCGKHGAQRERKRYEQREEKKKKKAQRHPSDTRTVSRCLILIPLSVATETGSQGGPCGAASKARARGFGSSSQHEQADGGLMQRSRL
jgi:hypothetical protein